MYMNKLHSRREFFKITAKKVLPVIGIISIANIPVFGNYLVSSNCNNACSHGCSNTCKGTHNTMCGACTFQCIGTCEGTSQNITNSHPQDSIKPKDDTIKGRHHQRTNRLQRQLQNRLFCNMQ